MKVIFSDRAFASIMAETTEKITTETGGLFLGTVINDVWYIIEAIDPGPKSIFQVAYFEYDQKYTQHLINKIANIYQEKLSLIGLWHRHPGSFDVFSSTDDGTNSKYAKMRKEGAISVLVNIDPKFRLTVYHVAQPCRYSKIKYEVGNNLIPEKFLKLKTPDRFEHIMQSILNPDQPSDEFHQAVSLSGFMSSIEEELKDKAVSYKPKRPAENDEVVKNKIIDNVLSDLMFMSDTLRIELSVVKKDNYITFVQDTIDGFVKIVFLYSADGEILFKYEDNLYKYYDGLFEQSYNKVINTNNCNYNTCSEDMDNSVNEEVVEVIEKSIDNNFFRGVLKLIHKDKRGEN